MKTSALCIVAVLSIITFNCQDVGVVPDYMKPGRRDYVWTVDTLQIPQGDYLIPSRIWGSASNDAWLACKGSSASGLLWHFDGSRWSRDSLVWQIDPSSLWGSANNDVWLGNSGDSFWKYNGISWYKFSGYSLPGYSWISVADIWGTRANSVWAVGYAVQAEGPDYRGVIMHFDGAQWQFVDIPRIEGHFVGIRQQRSSGLLFIDSWWEGQTQDTCRLYAFDGKGTLKELYTGYDEMFVEDIRGEVYFHAQQKIYKYTDGSLRLWRDFTNTNYYGWLKGRSELDILGIGRNHDIMHYNGTDFVTLLPNSMDVRDLFVLENAVFVVCADYDRRLICIFCGRLS